MALPSAVTISTRDLVCALIGAGVVAAMWFFLG